MHARTSKCTAGKSRKLVEVDRAITEESMVAKSFFTLRWYLQETRENEARQPKPLSLGQLHGDVLLFLLERRDLRPSWRSSARRELLYLHKEPFPEAERLHGLLNKDGIHHIQDLGCSLLCAKASLFRALLGRHTSTSVPISAKPGSLGARHSMRLQTRCRKAENASIQEEED